MEEDKSGPVYNVQCASSTDFVVGRQTNFNAPVTIIANGGSVTEETSCASIENGGANSGIVLCSRLLAEDTARAIAAANARAHQPNFVYINGEKATAHPPESKKPPDGFSRSSWSSLLQTARARAWLGVPMFVWIIIVIAVTCSFIGALVQILTDKDYSLVPASTPPPEEDCKNFLGNSSHLYLTRELWRGINATSAIAIKHPVPFVIISHTVTSFCYTRDDCSNIVVNIQKDTMSRTPPFADVPHNFLVGGDGNIYEARGWNNRSPHQGLVNNKNIDICFIGDFSVHDTPTLTQVDAVQQLLQHGVSHGHLAPDYLLLPHNATSATLSPGRKVYEIIKEWPHFSPKLPLDPKHTLHSH